MNKFRLALITSLTIFAGTAFSAEDGTLGTESVGESVLTVVKSDVALITGVDDINFGNVGVAVGATAAQSDMCVYASGGTYDVTVTSSNGLYALQDGTESIPYTVEFGEIAGPATAPYNTAVTGLAGNAVEQDCSGADNARLIVTLAEADVNGALAGTYTDTLILTIAAQ